MKQKKSFVQILDKKAKKSLKKIQAEEETKKSKYIIPKKFKKPNIIEAIIYIIIKCLIIPTIIYTFIISLVKYFYKEQLTTTIIIISTITAFVIVISYLIYEIINVFKNYKKK